MSVSAWLHARSRRRVTSSPAATRRPPGSAVLPEAGGNVTQHLSVLEAANLIATRWRGREKLHFLNPVPLQAIYERWIAKFEQPRLKALHHLKRRLEEKEDE